jgi:hypothetical protein
MDQLQLHTTSRGPLAPAIDHHGGAVSWRTSGSIQDCLHCAGIIELTDTYKWKLELHNRILSHIVDCLTTVLNVGAAIFGQIGQASGDWQRIKH